MTFSFASFFLYLEVHHCLFQVSSVFVTWKSLWAMDTAHGACRKRPSSYTQALGLKGGVPEAFCPVPLPLEEKLQICLDSSGSD